MKNLKMLQKLKFQTLPKELKKKFQDQQNKEKKQVKKQNS